MLDRVFDAAQNLVIDQVASVPDYEEIADVLIENDFGRRARIGATEDDGKRMLRLSCLRAPGGGRFALRNFAADKTRISFLEFGERGIRADRSDRMICAKNNRNDSKQTNEHSEFGCDMHGGS